jgi:archaellum biogenesis ATPase FlaH
MRTACFSDLILKNCDKVAYNAMQEKKQKSVEIDTGLTLILGDTRRGKTTLCGKIAPGAEKLSSLSDDSIEELFWTRLNYPEIAVKSYVFDEEDFNLKQLKEKNQSRLLGHAKSLRLNIVIVAERLRSIPSSLQGSFHRILCCSSVKEQDAKLMEVKRIATQEALKKDIPLYFDVGTYYCISGEDASITKNTFKIV